MNKFLLFEILLTFQDFEKETLHHLLHYQLHHMLNNLQFLYLCLTGEMGKISAILITN